MRRHNISVVRRHPSRPVVETLVGLTLLLVGSGWPAPAAEPVRTDGYGDPLPAGALARLGTGRFRGNMNMRCVALSPDGKLLAVGGQTQVQLLEMATGVVRLQLPAANEFMLTAVAFAPDGRTLAATGVRGVIHLWEVDSGKALGQIQGAHDPQPTLVFSADGQVLASGSRGHGRTVEVQVWQALTGKPLGRFEVLPNHNVGVTLSPDGKVLASWGQCLGRNPHDPNSQTVQRWEIATGRELPGLQVAGNMGVASACFSPDSKHLAASDGREVRLWEAVTGKLLRTFAASGAAASQLTFSPDGKTLLAGGRQGQVEGWELATGNSLRLAKGPKCALHGLVVGAEGKILGWGVDGQAVCLWDARTGKVFTPELGHQLPVASVAFAARGKVLVSASQRDGKLCWWEVGTGRMIRQMVPERQHPGWPENPVLYSLSPDGKYLATTEQNRVICLWDAESGREIRRLQGPSAQLTSPPVFSPDSRTLAVGSMGHMQRARDEVPPGLVTLWELASGTVRAELTGHQGAVTALAFSPDGGLLASGSADTTILLWDLTGRALAGPREGKPSVKLAANDLEQLWSELAADDGRRAYPALRRLVDAPADVVPFLQKRLLPVPGKAVSAEEIARLVADLDHEAFTVREQATRALEQLGRPAEAALRKALESQPSAEARRRVDQLLGKLNEAGTARALVRPRRALEVLERIGTAEAQQVVAALAQGQPDAPLTRDARAALGRMAHADP